MKNKCIFCKIIKGEIPATKVFENGKLLAFLDIRPVNPGHTLLAPKKHYENLLETPDEILQEMAIYTKKISQAIIKGVKAEGFNLILNNDRAAGQIVLHLHLHIIPRFQNDGLRLRYWPQKEYKEGEAEEIVQKIKKYLS